MATDKSAAPMVSPEEVAALAVRITALEQTLATKMPGFEAVGGRVSELSTAFQAANARLSTLEAALIDLQAMPAPSDEALEAIGARVDALAERVTAVENTRARGGRLSSRLASIETKLDQLTGGGNQ
jgi:uncharacterized coiled-coil protein SlyX